MTVRVFGLFFHKTWTGNVPKGLWGDIELGVMRV